MRHEWDQLRSADGTGPTYQSLETGLHVTCQTVLLPSAWEMQVGRRHGPAAIALPEHEHLPAL